MDTKRNKSEERTGKPSTKRVIQLDDLDVADDVVGGASEKLFFGESPETRNPFDKGLGGPSTKGFGSGNS